VEAHRRISCEVRTSYTQKSKAILGTRRGGVQGCEVLRFPHCPENRFTDGGEVFSLAHRLRSTSQKHSYLWYSFMLEDDYVGYGKMAVGYGMRVGKYEK
jgi:hypothetical protein